MVAQLRHTCMIWKSHLRRKIKTYLAHVDLSLDCYQSHVQLVLSQCGYPYRTLHSLYSIYLKGKENVYYQFYQVIQIKQLSELKKKKQNNKCILKFYISSFQFISVGRVHKLKHSSGAMSSSYYLLLSGLLRDRGMKKCVVGILLSLAIAFFIYFLHNIF